MVHSSQALVIPAVDGARPDPFIIDGPCLWSFSGGRTSAYMLWRALQAYGGKLPDDHVVAFANTGKEREETLRFVYECASRWGVDVRWVEWRPTPGQAARIAALAGSGRATQEIADWAQENAQRIGFEVVGLSTASRNGEPFEALIALKQALPNWQARWCTSILKIAPMHAYMMATWAMLPGAFVEPVGLRADEPKRITNMMDGDARTGRRRRAPLSRAGIAKADVLAFWREQGFGLDLPLWDGNCTLCMATGKGVRLQRLKHDPACGTWWQRLEVQHGQVFDRRDSVTSLIAQAPSFTPRKRDKIDTENECGDGGCDVITAVIPPDFEPDAFVRGEAA
jgi:3'-phosphoadenosine 5'-phosphosulfate sulfotransferase (PAPS reductase)/FAD synthetase